jgi:hypothetical protein
MCLRLRIATCIYFTMLPKAIRGLELVSYRGALLSIFYVPLYAFLHNSLNVLAQIANKTGLQKKRGCSQYFDCKTSMALHGQLAT